MDPLQAKANYSRVCQLLVDKGADALRRALHAIHPPSTLASVLNANKRTLSRIRYSVINPTQWNLLFPATGSPDSNNFDITLLTILLRNICGLPSPAAGWNVLPPASDTSISARILRIKILRNEVYGHIPSAQLDDTKFETLWQEISKPAVNLGIPQQDIDELKKAPLTPEEESYVEKLKEWKELEDDLFSKLHDLQGEFSQLRTVVENVNPSQTDRLAKFDSTGKIKNLCEKFQHGTRQWFFDKLLSWFRDEESNVMLLTAGPGVGKSVLSAKVCELYQQRGQLAAYHFCDFRTSDYRDPHRILQSLSSQMCDNVEGFRDKLTEVLRREHSRDLLSDAFRVLLNDPLHALDRREPMLIVVDALDESKTAIKSEFLELISSEFSNLPKWIKIFISSRPELQVRRKLEHLNPLEILPDDHQHNLDLKHFIQCCLQIISEYNVETLSLKCEGSFLYAYYLVNELKKNDSGIERNVNDYIPKGISGFYEKQFERLKTDLQRYKQDTGVSIFNSFINLIAASREPLPFTILLTCMGLSSEEFDVRNTIIGIMSEILPVYDDCLTVYHKSLLDWLTLNGYEEHAYAADVSDGNNRLWRACKNVYSDIDSLSSVSDFTISHEKRYALENGWKCLMNVGDTEDFYWLVDVKVNFLKLKFYGHQKDVSYLYADFFDILWNSKSNFSEHLYWRLNQLYTFYKILRFPFIGCDRKKICYFYLQYLANAHIGFLPNCVTSKNTASGILDQTSAIWLEEVRNESNSTFQIISNTVCAGYKNSPHSNHPAISSSPDNKLLACRHEKKLQVFELPSLRIILQLDVNDARRFSKFIEFSPDSSYFLLDSLQTCVSIKKQKEVPFIPHGPVGILSCSFSSCGTKLVTAESEFIKVWDLGKKELVAKTQGMSRFSGEVFFTSYNSYILACPSNGMFSDIAVFESTTLERLDVEKVDFYICLTYNDCVQIFSEPPVGCDYDFGIRVKKLCALPSGENVLFTNKYCSKPFTWKGRKCVLSSNSYNTALSLLVWDFISERIVDTFEIGCLPSYRTVNYLSNLGDNNFLICLDDNLVFVVSLESSLESFVLDPFVEKAGPTFCAISRDNSYVVCSYGCPLLTISSVDDGQTLQTVEPKQTPIACWWSELYLWVVCDGPVVVKYPYDTTQAKVLGNDVEECSLDCKGYVLKFAEGVLIVRLHGSEKISISKICDEKFSTQQILDSNFKNFDPEVAISSDGCAVLLYDACVDYECWEIACKDRWELLSTGTLDELVEFGCLTGTKNSRSSLWITSEDLEIAVIGYIEYCPLSLSSIDFPNSTLGALHKLPIIRNEKIDIIYAHSNLLIFRVDWEIYFIDVSHGEVITSFFVGRVDHFLFLPSKALLLLSRGNVITHFKIHNIDNYLPF